MTCGWEFVLLVAHDYLFSLWVFPERPNLDFALGLDGYTDIYKEVYKSTLWRTAIVFYIPQWGVATVYGVAC